MIIIFINEVSINVMSEEIYSKKIIHFGTVLKVEDDFDTAGSNTLSKNSFGRRIKVKLAEDDSGASAKDVPWVFPLLPKHLQVIPKPGEQVMVFFQDLDGPLGNRFYIGPIISQDYYLDNGGGYSAYSLLKGKATMPLCHPKGNPENDGTYPDSDVIAIQGRGDCAVWLKDEELRLMCGHKPKWKNRSDVDKADPGSLTFNKNDLAYIQMRYDSFNGGSGDGFKSAINVVADRINLVTHNGADRDSKLTANDQTELMTKESVEHIAENGERMVYGDKLISFLNKFRNVFMEHAHHWSNDPQVISSKDEEFWNKNLEELLCNTIRLA